MANEFIARKGLIALEDSQITGSLSVSGDITGSKLNLNDGSNNVVIGDGTGDTTSKIYATYVGYQAGQNASNNGVTAIGYQAGGGLYHTAVGLQAGNQGGGYKNTIGHGAGGQGNYSDTLGFQAGKINGDSNIAIGHQSLGTTGNGSNNLAIGYQAIQLMGNWIQNNIAIGFQAGRSMDAQTSLYSNNNIILGYQAGYNLSGSNNVVIGYQAGYDHIGTNKLIIANTGSSALIEGDFANNTLDISGSLSVSSDITGNGKLSLSEGTANLHIGLGATSSGAHNTIVGINAGKEVNIQYNTIIGNDAGSNANSGIYKTFLGHSAGTNNTGNYSTALGANSNRFSSGLQSIGIGYSALYNDGALGSNYSIAIGGSAGYAQSGTHNILLGQESAYNIIGNYNTILGYQAGYNASGSNNILLGYQAGYNLTGSNQLIIANNSSSALIGGDFANETVTISGSLNVTSSFTASGLNYPSADGTGGQVMVTDGAGNLSFDIPDAEKITFEVQNNESFTLEKGTPVHVVSMTGGTALVVAASASVASTMPSHGILNQQLTAGADGVATILGQITGVNTSGFSAGDKIYVGAFGGYTNVKPTGSANLIQNLGIVKKVDATNGTGEIFGSGRTNDVPNLPTGKIWVGSNAYTVTSSVLSIDESGTTVEVAGDISASGDLSIQDFTSVSASLATIPAISNPGDNRVLTSDGTANGVVAETGLTYDNTTGNLATQGTITGGGATLTLNGDVLINNNGTTAILGNVGNTIQIRSSGKVQAAGGFDLSSGDLTTTGDITASNAQLTTIAGPSDQLVELGNYPVGYDIISSFAITGSGLIVSASTLASNHYNMVKVGDIELIDLKSVVNPNTFLIHNVDQFSITSGSDGGDIGSSNFLMTHTGQSFVLHNNGVNMLSITNGAAQFTSNTTGISFLTATGNITTRINTEVTNTASLHSFAVYDSDPSSAAGAAIKNIDASKIAYSQILSGSLVYFGEESGTLSTGVSSGYQFSYGNGATGTIGIPVPVDCYAKKLMFQAETFGTSCTIDLYTGSITTNPVTDTGEGMTITGTEHGKVVDINPVFIAAGHYPVFRTTATSGTYSNVRVGVFLEYPIQI